MLFLTTAVFSRSAIWHLYVIHHPTTLWPSDRRQKICQLWNSHSDGLSVSLCDQHRCCPRGCTRVPCSHLLQVSLLFQQVSNYAKNPPVLPFLVIPWTLIFTCWPGLTKKIIPGLGGVFYFGWRRWSLRSEFLMRQKIDLLTLFSWC